MSSKITVGLFVAGSLLTLGAALADDYPSRPIRIIMPFTEGGSSDSIARAIASELEPKFGQRVLIENRPGANQIIAATVTENSPPDGYTFLWATPTLTSLNPELYKTLPYDPDKSFAPVSLLYTTREFLIVNSALHVSSLKEFIALAKAKPNAISYGSFGPGTLGHLEGIALSKAAGIEINHVPYKGIANIVPDLLANRIQAVFTSVWSILPQIHDGTLKVLALAQEQRSPNLPSVPTYKEDGIDLNMSAWLGLFAPAGTPPDIVHKVSAAFDDVVRDPAFKAKLSDAQDLVAVGSTPEYFATFIKKDRTFWKPVIAASGIEPQ